MILLASLIFTANSSVIEHRAKSLHRCEQKM